MPKGQENTQQGLIAALLSGDISTDEFLQMSEEIEGGSEQAESELDEVRGYTCPRCGEVGVVPNAEGKCPHCGAMLAQSGEQERSAPPTRRSAGGGARAGRAPAGIPSGLSPSLAGAGSFESLVSEACKMGHVKKAEKPGKKKKKKESLTEYAAPEWREVAMWARGSDVKRNSETQPYYFREDQMFSRKKLIAVRDLQEKKAKVLSPKVLDQYSGRHSVLAQHGLRSCGYQVEIVQEL